MLVSLHQNSSSPGRGRKLEYGCLQLDYHCGELCKQTVLGRILISGFKGTTRSDIITVESFKSGRNDTLEKRLAVELDAISCSPLPIPDLGVEVGQNIQVPAFTTARRPKQRLLWRLRETAACGVGVFITIVITLDTRA